MSHTPGDRTTNDELLDRINMVGVHLAAQDAQVAALAQRIEVLETTAVAGIAEIRQAVALPLALHRWWTSHKVRGRLVLIGGTVSIAFAGQVIGVIFHHFGWN